MTEINKITEIKNNGVPIAPSEPKQLIKIQGTLTSSIQLRGEGCREPYYYSFIKLKEQSIDLPVVFKIKEDDKLFKPNLKKSDKVELLGHYSNSPHSIRKSFTTYSYQIISEKRIRKKCFGCLEFFACYHSENYDYCKDCEINGSRYIPSRFTKSKCPECGDGSGIIKFPHQPPRSCKLCYLANQEHKEENTFTKNA